MDVFIIPYPLPPPFLLCVCYLGLNPRLRPSKRLSKENITYQMRVEEKCLSKLDVSNRMVFKGFLYKIRVLLM